MVKRIYKAERMAIKARFTGGFMTNCIYERGDVIIFRKNNQLKVGIIEGYYVEGDNIWFTIRMSSKHMYSHAKGDDIGVWDIVGKIEDEKLRMSSIRNLCSL